MPHPAPELVEQPFLKGGQLYRRSMMVSPNQNKFRWYCNTTVEKEVLRPCCPPAVLLAVIGSHNSTFAVSANIYVVQNRGPIEIPRMSIHARTSEVFSEAESLLGRLWGHLCTNLGACHYLTNRFQMKAPVAPSRSLREAFKRAPRSLRGACLREGFAEPSRRHHEPFAEVYEPFAEVAHTEGSTKTPWRVHEASSKGPWMNCMFLLDHDCNRVWSILYCF